MYFAKGRSGGRQGYEDSFLGYGVGYGAIHKLCVD